MSETMAVAFANILMARIEDQILRQSCIEPHPGHQRIFLGCGGMLRCRCRPTYLWSKAEQVTRGEAARKKAFHANLVPRALFPGFVFTRVTLNDFTKPETAHKKSLGTQAN